MTVIDLPPAQLHPAFLLANLRFALEADRQGEYRFRQVRLNSRVSDQSIERCMVDILENRTIPEALTHLTQGPRQPLDGAQESVTSFLRNLEKLLPEPPTPAVTPTDNSLAATEACRQCSKHRQAVRQRRRSGQPLAADQCECLREYRLRSALREAVDQTLLKIAG